MNNDYSEKREKPTAGLSPLAIIGLGCMFPQADDPEKFWTNIKTGTDCISEVPETHWRTADYYAEDPKAADKVYAKMGGFLSPVEFNPMDYGILPNAIEAIDTSQLLGLLTVEQALKDAGYGPDREYDRERVSVVLGVTGTLELVIPLGARLGYPHWREALRDAGVDDRVAADVVRRISDSYVPWQENSFPGLLGNVVAGRISKHFNLGGTNCVVDAACGSSLSAVNLAALELAAGRADMVVTGGIDTFNDVFMYTCFSKTPALSPSGHARPYDAETDGTTLGEGLGIVVLKRLADAERDGDKIYAVIKGIGTSSDGRGSAIYEPDAKGQAKALVRAYEQAGIGPESIELIEGHGTGTRVGDAIEVAALKTVFGPAERPWCALGSIKSQIGHTKAAAGAAGLIKTALALYHKVLPPTIKVKQPLDELSVPASPFYVNTEMRPWIAHPDYPRRAGISALGFGGSNFHCLLEEHQRQKTEIDWNGEVQILPFSAADDSELADRMRNFSGAPDWHELRTQAAELRQQFSAAATCRLILVLERGKADPAQQIATALSLLDRKTDEDHWATPDGIFYGRGTPAGRLAMLFPGQGAQYPHMLSSLAVRFPEFHATLEDADRVFAAQSGQPVRTLAELIYPRPGFSPADRRKAEQQLQATEVAQPALGAVSLGAARVLESFGVTAEICGGHSYGELTALCAADYFTVPELFALSRLRGELMAAGDGDRGSMLAVSAPLAEIEDFVEQSGLKLVLANKNTPSQGVLSGPSADIGKAAEQLSARGIACKQLDVAAAFHSSLVAAAAQPFAAELEKINFSAPKKKVFSNTTGAAYPAEGAAARELLAQQLASPVEFVSEIEQLYLAGVKTFVEVGPGARLTGMVKTILGEREFHALALDASNGQRSGSADLARCLSMLSALGHELKLDLWDAKALGLKPQSRRAKKPGISIKLCGANHYQPPQKRPPLQIKSTVAPAPTAAEEPEATTPTHPVAAATAQSAASSGPAAGNLQQALRITQQSLAALQSLQEQTAQLHQQFLQGQQAATESFVKLVQQQQHLVQGPSVGEQPPQNDFPTAAASAATLQPPEIFPESVPPGPTNQLGEKQSQQQEKADIAPLLLDIIAEKTGYPVEMLELEMALDSDLGIDSIKRVEILSALQEKLPGAPPVGPEDLGRLQTLGQIVEHLSRGGLERLATVPTAPQPGQVSRDEVATTLLEVIAEKTGYPVEMLELEMALDSDLGIDSIKRVEILSALQEKLPEVPAVGPEDLGRLQTLGQIVEHLSRGGLERVATVPTAPQLGQVSRDEVATTLLEVIAEKTGYPVEMLELEMALDSDLGIDSIKRVEILSALQEKLPGAPAVGPEDLGRLQTLGQIVEHLSRGGLERVATVPTAPQLGQVSRDEVATTLLEVIAEKTGYPVEMLELEMALDSDLGIDSIKRVEILSALQEKLPGAPAVKPEHLATLQTVGAIVDFLASAGADSTPGAAAAAEPVQAPKTLTRQVLKTVPLPLNRTLVEIKSAVGTEVLISDDGSALTEALCDEIKARGFIPRKINLEQLPDLSPSAQLAGLILLAPLKGANDAFLQRAFQTVRRFGSQLERTAQQQGAFLVSVSRLNGYFGLAEGKAEIKDPLSGGLAGLVKTAGLEWPSLHCKVLDLAMGMEILGTAKSLSEEIFRAGPLEVGISSRGLYGLELERRDPAADMPPSPVSENDVVVISGGARGVTAETAVALAKRTRATLLLLGRSPAPAAEPEWLHGLKTEAEIKQGIVQHADTTLKPVAVEREFRRIHNDREIRATLDRILQAGGTPLYRSVDLRNAAEVKQQVAEVRQKYGPVRGLIHGAGVLADKLIVDKTDAQFDEVYTTKIAGFRALLSAADDDELKFIALFSSSTARFGRIGQADYAVANEILNKIAQQQARLRSDCRVVALNWGPWDGGMVTPALKGVFAREGIDVIDLQVGSDYLVDELSQPADAPVELVILGGDADAAEREESEPQQNIYLSKAFDLDLSVSQYPFLGSHVLDGKAVLPMAIIVEWLAHGAMHNNPGMKFQGVNDLRILSGVKLGADETINLQVMTGKAFKSDGVHIVPVELSSRDAQGKTAIHARARMILGGQLPHRKEASIQLSLPGYPHADEDTYRSERLFHGAAFQGLREIIGCSDAGISALVNTAPRPGEWIRQPFRSSWLADPLVLDSSFQMLILWSFEQYQAGSLPVFAERYRQYQEAFPAAGVEVRVAIVERSSNKAVADIEFVDPLDGKLVARLDHYECVIDASLNASFQRNQLNGVA